MTIGSTREPSPGVEVDTEFLERWSPRAFAPKPIARGVLQNVFEAARWAPSCFNAQPWRFAYVLRDTPAWQSWLDLLVEGNRVWARNASALIAVISRTTYERNGGPAPTHSFDAGAAWMSLALQAARLGLASHGMQGFDGDRARRTLGVPDTYDLPAIVAIGYRGDVDALPAELREREQPSPRKSLSEIVFENHFEGVQP